jgi:DNA gyrase/topoisomerase IV subunit A
MDSNLPRLYKDYGAYSNYRNFPLDIDGLKPVERRVLLSAYKIARDKFIKSRRVDAHTTGHYHPHGSCYGSIVQLVRQGFLIGQGNFGTNVGVEPVGPAADRYTECRINPKTTEMVFKYVDNVQWVDSELGDREPLYLPTMFPICLMGTDYTQGIGFGYKTYIPCYHVKDLYQRLLWLLGIRKNKPIIAPITDCKILSDKALLDKLLTTGKAKVHVEGIVDINTKTNTAQLKSWPAGKRFESFLNKFSKELSEGLIGFTDLSVTETNIVFQVIRERNRDKIFEQFIEKMKEVIQGYISFEVVVVDSNQNVLTKSIDKMLLDTYKMFTDTNENMLKSEIVKIDETISEYNNLSIIRPTIISGITAKKSIEEIIEDVEKNTPVTKQIAKELISKYRISKLITIDVDTSQLINKKIEINNNLNDLSTFVMNQYVECLTKL